MENKTKTKLSFVVSTPPKCFKTLIQAYKTLVTFHRINPFSFWLRTVTETQISLVRLTSWWKLYSGKGTWNNVCQLLIFGIITTTSISFDVVLLFPTICNVPSFNFFAIISDTIFLPGTSFSAALGWRLWPYETISTKEPARTRVKFVALSGKAERTLLVQSRNIGLEIKAFLPRHGGFRKFLLFFLIPNFSFKCRGKSQRMQTL